MKDKPTHSNTHQRRQSGSHENKNARSSHHLYTNNSHAHLTHNQLSSRKKGSHLKESIQKFIGTKEVANYSLQV
jgi:hypothetical protein